VPPRADRSDARAYGGRAQPATLIQMTVHGWRPSRGRSERGGPFSSMRTPHQGPQSRRVLRSARAISLICGAARPPTTSALSLALRSHMARTKRAHALRRCQLHCNLQPVTCTRHRDGTPAGSRTPHSGRRGGGSTISGGPLLFFVGTIGRDRGGRFGPPSHDAAPSSMKTTPARLKARAARDPHRAGQGP